MHEDAQFMPERALNTAYKNLTTAFSGYKKNCGNNYLQLFPVGTIFDELARFLM